MPRLVCNAKAGGARSRFGTRPKPSGAYVESQGTEEHTQIGSLENQARPLDPLLSDRLHVFARQTGRTTKRSARVLVHKTAAGQISCRTVPKRYLFTLLRVAMKGS
jgi:hypothetical protein